MRVIDHLELATEPLISFEIIPPFRGVGFRKLEEKLVKPLAYFDPPFIDVTSHSSDIGKHCKRPGTLGICSVITHKYKIDSVPHVLCHGFTREETEDLLIHADYMGIENILALQGDKKTEPKPVPNGRSENYYAVDLVNQVVNLNKGTYLRFKGKSPTRFCIGVAGYPEKHQEAPDFETDLYYLKQKVDAGAEYIVTQMFFDNSKYFEFVDKCREKGITVPIIPGLKLITRKHHRRTLPSIFSCSLPTSLDEELQQNELYAKEIGIEWAYKQSVELLDKGVPGIHYYVMNNADSVTKVLHKLGK